MKFQPVKNLFYALVFLLLALNVSAQVAEDEGGSYYFPGSDYAPLLLFTNGGGKILRAQDGQILQVGRTYMVRAIPDPGYVFVNWNPVLVYTDTESTSLPVDFSTTSQSVSTVVSQINRFYPRPVLQFTLQPEELLLNAPFRTITVESGWQANFVKVTNRWWPSK